MLSVGSLFSGIGGLDLGLARAGFRHAFFCESDEYRRAVLRGRFPGVPVYEDVREVADGEPAGRGVAGRLRAVAGEGGREAGAGLSGGVDLLCGGFPCQDLSVAGRRAGLAGDRSGLFFEFARVAESLRPRFLLVENVPGLLSSNAGRDFGVVLGTLAELGYGLAYRILDSRYFGVPQRRRRVFILGVLAEPDPRAAAERAGEILAVGTRCEGHTQAGGEAGQDVAPTLGASVGGGRGWDGNPDRTALIAPPLTASMAEGDPPDQVAYVHSGGESYNESEQVGSLTQQSANETSAMLPLVAKTRSGTGTASLRSGAGCEGQNLASGAAPSIASPLSHGSNPNSNMAGRRREDDENLVAVHMLQDPISEQDGTPAWGKGTKSGTASIAVSDGAMVRRLTPTECERLQSLPDGWTDLGGTPDSRRYAALGDAVTANVSEWIGRRILGSLTTKERVA